MAKIKTQSIPPSLLAGYTKVFTVGNPNIFGFKKVGVTGTARLPQSGHVSKPTLALQLEAAKWLVEQWQPVNSSLFYAERLAEIKAFDFNETY